MSLVVDTLQALTENGFRLYAHCGNLDCRHSSQLDLKVLAEKLGPDFVAIGNPNPLVARLHCQKCGSKDLGMLVVPLSGYERGPFSSGPDFGIVGRKPAVPVNSRKSRRRVRLT
jgi:hypothetical protein